MRCRTDAGARHERSWRHDLRRWQRFRAVAAPYCLREEKWLATGLLVPLLLGQTGFSVLFNRLTGEFTSALAAKDADRFWKSIAECLAILVFFLVIYAVAGTAVTVLVFGKVLIGRNFFQLTREADFRFSLVGIRENAEAIAFYRGEMRRPAPSISPTRTASISS